MRRLGQHFLKNGAVIEKIVASLSLAEGERVIEIGPGRGALTAPLLRAVKEVGGSVMCVEKDRTLVAGIAALGERELPGRFAIEEGDALKLLPDMAGRMAADGVSYKLAGNIPYYITGKLFRILSELEKKPSMAVLMVQSEVAERVCAAAGDMNRLAASVQFWADPSILLHVPRKDFSPPPEVDSAVVALKTRTEDLAVVPALYYKAVRALFAQPRKTLLNNLESGMRPSAKKGSRTPLSKEKLSSLLLENGVIPESRPQDLSIEAIVSLAKAIPWG